MSYNRSTVDGRVYAEMSDQFIKPGNHERGWNDPPQFSYSFQKDSCGVKQKCNLNKRVHSPQLAGSASEVASATADKLTPPRDIKPPPIQGTTSTSVNSILSDQTVTTEGEPCIEDVQASLYEVLSACRHTVKKQICDDVERRLKLFEDMWKNGKLSSSVKHRMYGLSQDLKRKNWDAADEIHRGLMVDHVSEVSQWMVGVKRLIAEARSLNTVQSAQSDQNQLNNTTDPGL